jgi:hypothetical protein
LGDNKKGLKIVREEYNNYTFVDTNAIDDKQESEQGVNNPNSAIEKDLLKKRSIDSKKSNFRYKGRLTGGHNKQGHSSVYE